MKRVVVLLLALAMIVNLVACGGASQKIAELGNSASETAGNLADAASDGFNAASGYVSDQYQAAKNTISNLSMPDFQKGYEMTAGFFGATIASLGGQAYVTSVANAIDDLQRNISNRVSSSSTTASNAGNLAEEWHAGTFNIDAAARGSKINASTPQSNGLGSHDIELSDGTNIGSKYYKTAEESAKQQAQNYLQRYNKYKRDASNPLSMDDWLKENKINITAEQDLYWSVYKDQVRVIPADQLDDAIAFLDKAAKSNAVKDPANRKYVSEADFETLKNLTDRVKAADGTESIPLTKADAEAIANAARDGEFDPKDFHITTAEVISGKYIAKQAVKSGATAALIEAAIVLGPEIYEIIRYGIETGELDEEQLKNAGIDGLSAAGDGFLKGSISNALVVMCKAGKLGAEYANPSPELVGALTVLVIDAIRYGVMMANGKMSTTDYIDTMAEEVFVSAGAMGTAALVGLLFPGATLAIMLGGFVGGLVVSSGYAVGKTYALAMIENTDVDMLVPVKESASTLKKLAETASTSVSDALSALKNFGKKTTDEITIKLYDATSLVKISA